MNPLTRPLLLLLLAPLSATPALGIPELYDLQVSGAVAEVLLEPVSTPLGHLVSEGVDATFRYDANEPTAGISYGPASPSALEVTSSFVNFTSQNGPSPSFPDWPSGLDLEALFEDDGFDEVRLTGIAPLSTGIFDPSDELTGAILILTASGGGAFTGIPRDGTLGLGDFDSVVMLLFGTENPSLGQFDDNWVLRVELSSLSLTAVPEPGSIALLGLAGLALARLGGAPGRAPNESRRG